MGESNKCSVCGKPATVHLTQIVDNKLYKVDLCEECAQQKGVTDPAGFSLAEMISSKPSIIPGKVKEDVVCEHCGFSAKDLKRTGRLGCPECYEKLMPILEPMLKNMHRGIEHKGKVPSRSIERVSLKRKIDKLEGELQKAVAEERFEEAANYRDEIKRLRDSLPIPHTS